MHKIGYGVNRLVWNLKVHKTCDREHKQLAEEITQGSTQSYSIYGQKKVMYVCMYSWTRRKCKKIWVCMATSGISFTTKSCQMLPYATIFILHFLLAHLYVSTKRFVCIYQKIHKRNINQLDSLSVHSVYCCDVISFTLAITYLKKQEYPMN